MGMVDGDHRDCVGAPANSRNRSAISDGTSSSTNSTMGLPRMKLAALVALASSWPSAW
jgi:hypothetical protein